MADDTIRSLDSPVLDYFPEYKDLQTPERRKIRLRDVLPMTSGLHWDEWSEPYAGTKRIVGRATASAMASASI
jgi:CubicO group peptidase (beta-lactamase class C family)